MTFEDKFISQYELDKQKQLDIEFKTDKLVVNNEAFAVGTIIQTLIDKIDQLRRNLK